MASLPNEREDQCTLSETQKAVVISEGIPIIVSVLSITRLKMCISVVLGLCHNNIALLKAKVKQDSFYMQDLLVRLRHG